jgi:hypothetical protein
MKIIPEIVSFLWDALTCEHKDYIMLGKEGKLFRMFCKKCGQVFYKMINPIGKP